MDLSELKRNRDILLSVLGIKAAGSHLPCPFHGGGDSFSVVQGKDGCWIFKCNSQQCAQGTVIDAAMRVYNRQTPRDALLAIEKELGIKIFQDCEYIEPIIDQDAANAFVNDAHQNLLESESIQETWMRKKRGIFDMTPIIKYRVGFVTPDKFGFSGKAASWNLFGWVLPITNAAGVLVAVKIHTEKALFPWAPLRSPKCVWAPFGTLAACKEPGKPLNGTATLWPPPEDAQGAERLYLCPGELKALAVMATGLPATSPTGGESKMRSELVRRIVRSKPGKTFVAFDDDDPRMIQGRLQSPGHEWRDGIIAALKKEGMSVYATTTQEAEKESAAGSIGAIQGAGLEGKAQAKVVSPAKPITPVARDKALFKKSDNQLPKSNEWSLSDRTTIAWLNATPRMYLPMCPFELYPDKPGTVIRYDSFFDNLLKAVNQPRDILLGAIADGNIKTIRQLMKLSENMVPF